MFLGLDIPALVCFSLSIVIIVFLVIRNIILRNKWKKLSADFLQLSSDNIMIVNKMVEMSDQIEQLKLQNSDGFVKFLAQSRDWAFEYIEQVQNALAVFDTKISEVLKYINTYGTVNGENLYTGFINDIGESWEELKKVLPNDPPNN